MCGPVQGATIPTSATQVAGASGGGSSAPATTGGRVAAQPGSATASLRELAGRLGGSAGQASVAGASGDATGGGAAAGVEQLGGPLPKGAVGGGSGPGKTPEQSTGQLPGQGPGHVGGKRGKGHHFAPGKGHAKHGHVMLQAPVAQFGGTTGAGGAQKPGAQVAGDSGVGQQPAKPATEKPAAAPVTQVAGESGTGDVGQQPLTPQPVVVQTPEKPVTQVAGERSPAVEQVAEKQPVAQVPSTDPFMSDEVRLLEVETIVQLSGKDNSLLQLDGSTITFHSRTNQDRTFQLPPDGIALVLSDGTKFSVGAGSSNEVRDLEVIGADGGFVAARLGDGEYVNWAKTPLTPGHLLEIASMISNKEYGAFGSDGTVVQQS